MNRAATVQQEVWRALVRNDVAHCVDEFDVLAEAYDDAAADIEDRATELEQCNKADVCAAKAIVLRGLARELRERADS